MLWLLLLRTWDEFMPSGGIMCTDQQRLQLGLSWMFERANEMSILAMCHWQLDIQFLLLCDRSVKGAR